jgi:protein-disulfide isomerase
VSDIERPDAEPGVDPAPAEPSAPEPARAPADSIVTIRVQRSHLYGAVGVLAGLVAGLLIGRFVLAPDASLVTGAAPTTAGTTASAAPAAPTGPVDVDIKGRPFKGNEDAKVTVVEFTDYQCPFCKRHFDTVLTSLLKKHGKNIRYVVRNFPIPSLHPLAQKASEAAECALEQDKFWEYHDYVFAHQDEIAVEQLKEHARAVGLNGADFDQCLDDGEKASVVKKDVDDGTSYGVTGTPTFFINGEIVKGAIPLTTFETHITKHLN